MANKKKIGSRIADAVSNQVSRLANSDAVKNLAKAQQDFRKATDKIPGIQAAERAVNGASSQSSRLPAARVAQGAAIASQAAANKANFDPRVGAGLALLGTVAVGGVGRGRIPNTSNAARNATAARALSLKQKVAQSASPGIAQRVTKAQAATNAAKAATRTTTTTAGRTVSRSVTAPKSAVVRDASGPIKQVTDGRAMPRGNTVVKEQATNRELTRSLKEKAQTQYVKQETYGSRPSNKQPKAGQDHRGYMPDRGRRSPTAPTIADKKDLYRQKLNEKIPSTANGTDRRAAQRANEKKVTQLGKTLERKAKDQVQTFQANAEAKARKGSTPSSRQAMAEDMAKRPKAPVKRTSTTTTGTKRVPANPTTRGEFNSQQGDRVTRNSRGIQGRVLTNKDGSKTTIRPKDSVNTSARRSVGGNNDLPGGINRARTVDPKTGRPGLMSSQGTRSSAKPSPTRTRGSNSAENLSASARARINRTTESERQALARRSLRQPYGPVEPRVPDEVRPPSRNGLDVRPYKRGQTSGIRPTDARGSSTPARFQGSATNDRVQTRNGRKVGRLGQENQWNIDTPETVRRRATVKLAAKDNGPSKPAKPSNSPKAQASRSRIKEATKASRASRQQTKGLSKEERAALQRELDNRVYEDLKPKDTTGNRYQVTRQGEVRLQGTTKGGRYQTGSESGTKDGRVDRVGPHDGQPSRSVANRAQQSRESQGRSAEARAQSQQTLDAVRKRAATKRRAQEALSNTKNKLRPGVKKSLRTSKPANTISASANRIRAGLRNAVDRKGNNLNAVMLRSLKRLQR